MSNEQELQKKMQENSLKTAQIRRVINQIEKKEHDAMNKYLDGNGDGFDLRNELDKCTVLKNKALDDFSTLRKERRDIERQLMKVRGDDEPER